MDAGQLFYDWRSRMGLTRLFCANRLGCTEAFLYKVEKKGVRPGNALRRGIAQLSNGEVPEECWETEEERNVAVEPYDPDAGAA